MNRTKTIIFGLAVSGISGTASAACLPTDITIKQADWHRTSSHIVAIVGELINGCAEPIGVQLAFTFRDEKGAVVAVKEHFPAGLRNIDSKATYPFEVDAIVGESAKTMTARVLGFHKWRN